MTLTVTNGSTAGSGLIGGTVSPSWTQAVPLPTLADKDLLIVWGWGATQVANVSGIGIRSGTPAGTVANTGWSISGSGWSTICDEIGDQNTTFGRSSRLFAAWRYCDGTETGFSVTGAGPNQGWDNSTVVGVGLKVGAIRLRSDTGRPRLDAGPVVSSSAVTNTAWQPTGLTATRAGVGLALMATPLNAPSTGWASWSGSAAPRGGSDADTITAGLWQPSTVNFATGSGDAPVVAAMAFADTATGFRYGLRFGLQQGGF